MIPLTLYTQVYVVWQIDKEPTESEGLQRILHNIIVRIKKKFWGIFFYLKDVSTKTKI